MFYEINRRILDSLVSLIHHDPSDLGLICFLKKRTVLFRIFKNPMLDNKLKLTASQGCFDASSADGRFLEGNKNENEC